jgi:hypothetical protein
LSVDNHKRDTAEHQDGCTRQSQGDGLTKSRIIRCAFLAPEIVEAVLEGREPAELTLDKLLDNLPLEWTEQI